MSVSFITDADIPSITRTPGVLVGVVDSGTGMNVHIAGTLDVSVPDLLVTGVTPSPSLSLGLSGNYDVGGAVDFDSIITEIPDAAQITKVEVIASADFHAAIDTDAAQITTCKVKSESDCAGKVKLQIPTGFTPLTDIEISDTDSDVDGSFDTTTSTQADAAVASTFINKVWDMTVDPGQYPLGYITRAQLVSQFSSQKIRVVRDGSFSFVFGNVDMQLVFPAVTGHIQYTFTSLFNVTVSGWLMTVTWEFPLSWTLNVPTDPIEEGDEVTAESPLVDGIDFEQVTTAALEWTDSGGFHSIPITIFSATAPTNWIFTVPPGTLGPFVHVVITSTQFSGSVDLGKLVTIFFLNATGIYTLVPGKTNDTIYDNAEPGTTVDVKIPNPTFKTGFIGG